MFFLGLLGALRFAGCEDALHGVFLEPAIRESFDRVAQLVEGRAIHRERLAKKARGVQRLAIMFGSEHADEMRDLLFERLLAHGSLQQRSRWPQDLLHCQESGVGCPRLRSVPFSVAAIMNSARLIAFSTSSSS